MADDELFSREEVLAGRVSSGDVRRARALVYLIEQETARSAHFQQGLNAVALASASGVPVELGRVLDAEALAGPLPGERDEAFLASFRAARRQADSPELKRLDRHAPDWQVLVPDRLDLRVRVFADLASRYEIDPRKAKRLCEAFGVDAPDFAAAYERVIGAPLEDAFVVRKGLFGRRKA